MKKHYTICVCILAAVSLSLSVSCWFKKSTDISTTERRKLTQFPTVTLDTILDGSFASNFESYATDQFPLRDSFRTLKAMSQYYVFQQKDNNGIYLYDGYAAKLEYPLNEASLTKASKKFNALYEQYLKDANCNIYLSVVPDKGYYMAKKGDYLSMDYETLFSQIKAENPFATYIPIEDKLSYTDYYKTDTHWRQEKLVDVAKKLASSMGIAGDINWNFTTVKTKIPFYGVYYGQAALPLKSDTLCYLTNDILAQATTFNTETDVTTGIYDMEKLISKDPYEMFLSGATPLLTINNPNATTKKELVLFRDSFASSIAPLFTQAYSKITLVDIRYMVSDLVGQYVDFTNADVLFLYSTLVLNNSSILR